MQVYQRNCIEFHFSFDLLVCYNFGRDARIKISFHLRGGDISSDLLAARNLANQQLRKSTNSMHLPIAARLYNYLAYVICSTRLIKHG